MVGIWQAYADVFLYVAGVAMLLAYGIPLLVAPLAWARFFHWEIPASKSLVVFLGRSLGLIISVVALLSFLVTRSPLAMPFFFDMMLRLFVAMIGLHVYGAIRRIQPRRETLEILMWAGLFVVTLFFHP